MIDAEMMETELKINLADVLYNKLNMSRSTVFGMLDIPLEDEREKRELENSEGMDKVFYPRDTAYTKSGGSDVDRTTGGRPADEQSKDEDKQQEDKLRNKIKK